ncbi:MAG: helix-turn-helix domain-containing protein [Bacteroidetes bacterium]|nr:helix-turn-helix domain-containing protein [Bacteroidota bacterium]
MENITIPADLLTRLLTTLDKVDQRLETKSKEQPLSEIWLDVSETCQVLKISKRTLQEYRNRGVLSFSQINGKIYFCAKDIEEHLNSNKVKAFAPRKRR